jgi:hypothetical protein
MKTLLNIQYFLCDRSTIFQITFIKSYSLMKAFQQYQKCGQITL